MFGSLSNCLDLLHVRRWKWPRTTWVVLGLVWARLPALEAREFCVRAWHPEQGLPDATISAIRQTRDGYLWVATRAGLARFDGVRFTVFNRANTPAMVSENCWSLVEDVEGALWVGTEAGLLCFKDHQLRHLSVQDDVADDKVTALCPSATGGVWAGTGGTVKQAGGQAATRYTETHGLRDRAEAVLEDRTGRLWIGPRRGLYFADPNASRLSPNVAPPEHDEKGAGILQTNALGELWVAFVLQGVSINRVLTHFWVGSITRGQWTELPGNPRHNSGRSFFLLHDQAGALWLPAGEAGLKRLHNGQWTSHPFPPEEPQDFYQCGFEDHEGNLWFGTEGAGLQRWTPRRIEVLSTREGLLHDQTWTVFEGRDGSVWIGTDGGLSRLRDGALTHFTEREGLSRNDVRSLVEDDAGRLWIGTGAGLDLLEAGRLRRFRFPGDWANTKIRALSLGPSNTLWVGTVRSLHLVDLAKEGESARNERLVGSAGFSLSKAPLQPKGWTTDDRRFTEEEPPPIGAAPGTTPDTARETRTLPASPAPSPWSEIHPLLSLTTSNGLAHDEIRGLLRDRSGALWIGTAGGGAHRLRDGRLEHFSTTNGLSSDFVWVFHEDAEGGVWIGTERGLNRFHEGRLTRFTTAQGLPDNVVNQILEDHEGQLWIGCGRGIYRVRKQALADVAAGRSPRVTPVVYNQTEGLLSSETSGQKSQPAAWQSRDGRLWFSTAQGVVVFDPRHLPDNPHPPRLVIEQIRANAQVVFDNAGTREPAPTVRHSSFDIRHSPVVFPPGAAHLLEIVYTANTFVAAEQVRFQYRLDGVDPDWIDAGPRRTAPYANLRPGLYTWRLRAANKYGVWTEPPTLFTFRLQPYVHQTWAFRGTVALALGGLVFAFYRWRLGYLRRIHHLEQDKALAEDRARIMKDLHDDLGAHLTRVTLLAQASEREAPAATDTPGRPDPLSQLTRDTALRLREIIWMNHPGDETLEGLAARICGYAEEFLGPAGVRCRFHLPDTWPHCRLKPDARRQTFLVAKEALHNVVKHARARQVEIAAAAVGAAFRLTIEDDGQGFAPTGPQPSTLNSQPRSRGLGLDNMRRRVEALGGRFQLTSQTGQGTRVQCEIPLHTLGEP